MPTDPLFDLLRPERLTAVVDVGANPIDDVPPYKSLLTRRLCTVVGFEPQAAALAKLNAMKSDLETYLPAAIGDGSAAVLKVCREPGMTSLLTPEPRVLACFPGFSDWGRVIEELSITTRTLDSIAEIAEMDFLKIDAQGAELAIFRGGRARLSRAVAIQTEVSFVPLYQNQPSFGDIDRELRDLGYIPHTLAAIHRRLLLPLQHPFNIHAAMNQLLEADIVYVRDFTRPELIDSQQFQHLALIAHHCYNSYDLALKCIHELIQRGEYPSQVGAAYAESIPKSKVG
jgi:FkbM family methyltransferase